MKDNTSNLCQRCGVCCEKGGPSLHIKDRRLVDSGRIPARCLFTIRQGELARDNVKGTLEPMAAELIKIKGVVTVFRHITDEIKRIATEFERRYPYMPDRIIDNIVNKQAKISVTNWEKIKNNPDRLESLIEATYKDRSNCNYDLSRPMRRKNS